LKKTLIKLEKEGLDVSQIPEKEIKNGEGEAIQSFSRWNNYMEFLQTTNYLKKLEQIKALRSEIENWRSKTAVQFRTAPFNVMPEHLLLKVAYVAAFMSQGTLEKKNLINAGVHSSGIESLLSIFKNGQ